MTEDKTHRDGGIDGIDDALAALKAETPAPDGAFMARVMGDALAEMPHAVVTPAPVARRRPLASFFEIFGGWRGGVALAASAMIGVMVGYADPTSYDPINRALISLQVDGDSGYEDAFAGLVEDS